MFTCVSGLHQSFIMAVLPVNDVMTPQRVLSLNFKISFGNQCEETFVEKSKKCVRVHLCVCVCLFDVGRHGGQMSGGIVISVISCFLFGHPGTSLQQTHTSCPCRTFLSHPPPPWAVNHRHRQRVWRVTLFIIFASCFFLIDLHRHWTLSNNINYSIEANWLRFKVLVLYLSISFFCHFIILLHKFYLKA